MQSAGGVLTTKETRNGRADERMGGWADGVSAGCIAFDALELGGALELSGSAVGKLARTLKEFQCFFVRIHGLSKSVDMTWRWS